MSAYLFIVALELEVLLVKIRSEEGIKGIVVDKEIKLAAFADDLTTFLHDVNSLENLSVILHRFEMCSGLKLNAKKTEPNQCGKKRSRMEMAELDVIWYCIRFVF